jgi:putative effector of murein hydrolase LrgA (UPF0299 family)
MLVLDYSFFPLACSWTGLLAFEIFLILILRGLMVANSVSPVAGFVIVTLPVFFIDTGVEVVDFGGAEFFLIKAFYFTSLVFLTRDSSF